MEFVVLIPAILLFLFFLYKFSGDDHVLIRKNISLEQMFDIAFNTLWISLLFSRIYYFLVESGKVGNFFIAFFTTKGELSFPGAMGSGIITLYLIGKYKKLPTERLFDFFTLSLLFALPIGYLGFSLLHINQKIMLQYLICGLIYLIASILFRKFFYPKLLNRTLKEGRITIYFLMIFPLITYATTFINGGKSAFSYLTITNLILLAIFLLSLVLYIKQERGKLRRRAQ